MLLSPVARRTASLLSSLSVLLAGGVLTTATAVAAPATAEPVATATVHRDATTPGLTEDESTWREVLDDHPDIEEVWTHSPSMNRDIPLLVRPASEPGAPTLYLLNGVDGGREDHHWFGQGLATEFFADKNVNVVVPVDGKNSYYSDWLSTSTLDRADRGGQRQQWGTYLAEELPGPLEASLHANGTRAVAGVSMAATSAVQLVQDNPGLYSAAAGLSGCYDTTSPQGRGMVDAVVSNDDSGATTDQLWGPVTGDVARAHDPAANVGKLRPEVQGSQLPLYISAARGNPSGAEARGLREMPDVAERAGNLAAGTGLEAGAFYCTMNFERQLADAGVPATVHYAPAGMHSWHYFSLALQDAWPTLSRGLGV